MSRYPTGQPIRVSGTVRDVTGTLVNATALTLTVQKPDATTQDYASPANDGTGLYHQDIPAADLAQLGHYAYKWVATGTGAGVAVGDFDVYDPFEPAVLPLQDAKDMLNIPQTTTTYDNEISAWLATVESVLERFTGGPIVNRTITERATATANWTAISVRQRPLVSVTSIVNVASGQAVDITNIELDANAGIIRRKLGWPFVLFWAGPPVVTVTYVAGWGTAVPPAFNAAARVIIDHLWQIQHGPSVRPSIGGLEEAQTYRDIGLGFSVPNRAIELLAPYSQEVFV